MKTRILGIIAVSLSAAGLQAQVGVGSGVGGGIGVGSRFQQAGTLGTVVRDQVFTFNSDTARATVTGRPLTGTEERKSTQTLGDGTIIATSETDTLYRDSQGRTRVEQTGPGRQGISIVDPVAGVMWSLNPAAKTARKMEMPKGDAVSLRTESSANGSSYSYTFSSSSTSTESGPGRGRGTAMQSRAENTKEETLDPQLTNNVLATGKRSTLTIPQGQIGNSRDIHVVNERWYSDDLQMLVRTVNSDPRFGENIYDLTNITRAEPDPALFQVPGDYTVTEAAKRLPATITIDK